MSLPNRMVWIDDNPSRESTARDLGAQFINVKGKDLGPEIKDLLNGREPQVVVIDHVLDKASDSTHPVLLRGSTIAEALKEKWPHCAVIGVTNAHRITDIDLRTKGTYDALFPFQDFGRYFDRIAEIGRGFTLVSKTGADIHRLVRLLRPPKDEVERVHGALTDDLKAATQDASLASRMYRWVSRLLDRPGFLLDQLWSATLLGLNEAGFLVLQQSFEHAKYKGVFFRPDEPHWWSSQLAAILYTQCPPAAGELSWHAGRRLPGVEKQHYSVCYHCKKDFPETVAFVDEASNERHAMHLRCTDLHPRHNRELYFEDIRVMRGD